MDLGAIGDVVARCGFILSAAALLVAVTLAIAGVLMPQKYRGLGRQQLDDFGGPAFQSQTATEVRRALLGAIVITIAQDRSVNDCKARLTKGVAQALLIGFVGLAAAAVTLASHTAFGTVSDKTPPKKTQASPPPPPLKTEKVEKSENGSSRAGGQPAKTSPPASNVGRPPPPPPIMRTESIELDDRPHRRGRGRDD